VLTRPGIVHCGHGVVAEFYDAAMALCRTGG